jgi:uncharacterized protein with PIN domain
MSAVVSKKGLKPTDQFVCDDCSDIITAHSIMSGEMVYYVKEDRSNPNNSKYRCENCQDEIWTLY